ncbi:S1 RNA-binding domain-containing protein [Caminibacter pacificus]|jgi:small subunit ribosomal protein S1|uniref:S1 RNA-binding domain-containing protein n=1 Tax=Caminibacter pacificus TaxID=1424653 RepID=A0AAJ4UYE6_9BACT|nr:S1 RNA-binding domain-containing protein [Caminibacter pacificus]NPA87904.1 S1 RNA-binding domain-containing protein [Campylobacterota bacterium]QCI28410.1 S1 RNA-binding domain-containing protein [Caminibacter pacificus]ROR40866.1 small subunit ribosomal protein S1 [Caminibacter pacificus]
MNELKIGDVVEFQIEKLIKGGFVGNKDGVEYFLPKSLSGLKEDESVIGKIIKAKVKEFKQNSVVVDRKAYLNEVKEKVEALKDKIIPAKVTKVKPSGLVIDIDGISGFVPKDEIFYKKIDHRKYFDEGDEIEVVLIDPERRVFSIKKALPNPWEEVKNLNIGDRIKVTVSHITDYGAFVDLGNGVEGFLHISEINWDGINDLTLGEEIEVEIVEINPEEERLRVTRKNLLEKPASKFAEKYNVGDVVEGIITKFINVGAFVEVDGISVLLPNKFASYKKGEKASDIFEIGDKLEFKVVTIIPEENKVIVSRKDAMQNPYDIFAQNHVVGDEIQGKVKYITDFGMFIDLGDVEALVRKEDYSKEYEIGDDFIGKIIEINGERIKLSE